VSILTIADRHIPYAEKITRALEASALRVSTDFRNEKIGLKIREAQLQKIPQMWVVGDREMEDGTVSVRHRDGRPGEVLPWERALAAVAEENRSGLALGDLTQDR
ncbi:MAG: His/Gly/Thr/Pro-type tRNA ligase C-terminal domain-containing protein, partial [Nitrospiraceae bacterium]|nr:His/Gly/Thr/Pro-type tRNA ligase C-terminal domain-containing protein [Nitrospiraceae bacterium]